MAPVLNYMWCRNINSILFSIDIRDKAFSSLLFLTILFINFICIIQNKILKLLNEIFRSNILASSSHVAIAGLWCNVIQIDTSRHNLKFINYSALKRTSENRILNTAPPTFDINYCHLGIMILRCYKK